MPFYGSSINKNDVLQQGEGCRYRSFVPANSCLFMDILGRIIISFINVDYRFRNRIPARFTIPTPPTVPEAVPRYGTGLALAGQAIRKEA
jgi:hypothetical protein